MKNSLGLFVLLAAATMSWADNVNLVVAADTSITSGSPNNNDGSHPWFNAGTDGPIGGNAIRRGLLRFDLSGIPANSTITSAVVNLTVTRVPATDPVDSDFDLWRLLAAWGEGSKSGNAGAIATAGEVTWNSRLQDSALWTEAGAKSDAVTTPSATTLVGSAPNTTYSWSGTGLISDVQFWLDHPEQNFGWLLTSQAEQSSRSVRGFASRESGANAGMLIVGYTPGSTTNTPVRFTGITLTNSTNIVITWSGNTGPFILQQKRTLSDPAWTELTNSPLNQVIIPVAGFSGFMRIQVGSPEG